VLTVAVIATGLFMMMLDNTVLNVALPSIQQDLGVRVASLEWVVTGYTLTFAAILLIGGKLADMLGRRRMFLIGMGVFTLASLVSGLSTSITMLIGGRILQGIGGALMNPASLSLIAASFPVRQRGAAIGLWSGIGATALATGPLVGGLLTQHLSWHWIFFVNLPIGILGMTAGYLLISESRDESADQQFDIPGLVTSAVGLFALTYGLIEGNTYGWDSPRIVAAFVVAGVALSGFLLLERHQRAPMLDLSLFRSSTYVGANVSQLFSSMAMFGVSFFLSIYLQRVLGYSPVQSGLAFVPMTVLIVFMAPFSGRLSDRIGSRRLMTVGMSLVGVALLTFSRLDLTSTYWELVPGFVLAGIGMPMAMASSAAAAMRAVSADKAGVGSAVLNSFRQVGGSLGLALMGAIVAVNAVGSGSAALFVGGLERALHVAAAIAFLGAVISFATVREGSRYRRFEEPVLLPAETR